MNSSNSSINSNISEYVYALIVSIIVFLLFVYAHTNQSEIDITNFQICLNSTACTYEIIQELNDTTICNKSTNSTQCFLYFALGFNDPNLCEFSENKLRCIITLSIEEDENYCNNLELEKVEICNNSIEIYRKNSVTNSNN